MPASLERSAKAVHPEGYGLFFNFLPATRNARLQKLNGAKSFNSVSLPVLSSSFVCFTGSKLIVLDTNSIGSTKRMQYPE